MKEFFKYIGLSALAVFSFYYTNEVVEKSIENDSIMVSITKHAEDNNIKCKEGYMTEEGVVLGISGIIVDEHASYSRMKGIGYKKDLIEYDKDECIVSKDNNLKSYIIRGNELKNSATFVIEVTNMLQLNNFVAIAETKNIKFDILVDLLTFNENIEKFKNLYSQGFNIVFKGDSEEDLKSFLKTMKTLDKTFETYCIGITNETLNICSKNKVNSIKIDNIIDKQLLTNTKNSLSKGSFILVEENLYNLNEFSATINYIESKGLNIVNLKEHLS